MDEQGPLLRDGLGGRRDVSMGNGQTAMRLERNQRRKVEKKTKKTRIATSRRVQDQMVGIG